MRLVLCTVAALALLSACGGSSTANPTATLTEATVPAAKLTASHADQETPLRSARILSMDLLAEDQGWALTDERLGWTSDGGMTWTDVTPPQARGEGGRAFFLDQRHGWVVTVVASERGLEAPSTVTVYRTSDGGLTWDQTQVDGPRLAPDSAPPLLITDPQFVDEENGWLIGRYVTGNRASLYLARTSDGGATWTEFEFTEGGAVEYDVQFVNPQDGWMTILGPSFLVTHDGGESWQDESLPLASGCEARTAGYDVPTFFAPERGVLAVHRECGGEQGTTFYVTEDGGSSWEIAGVRTGGYDLQPLTFTWWLAAHEGGLLATKDGGVHWDDVSDDWASLLVVLGRGEDARYDGLLFDFASQASGWAWLRRLGLIAATSDGGRTWELRDP